MKDLREKSKLLADLDKYEHELSSLEDIQEASYLFCMAITRKINSALKKIEICKHLLKDDKEGGDD